MNWCLQAKVSSRNVLTQIRHRKRQKSHTLMIFNFNIDVANIIRSFWSGCLIRSKTGPTKMFWCSASLTVWLFQHLWNEIDLANNWLCDENILSQIILTCCKIKPQTLTTVRAILKVAFPASVGTRHEPGVVTVVAAHLGDVISALQPAVDWWWYVSTADGCKKRLEHRFYSNTTNVINVTSSSVVQWENYNKLQSYLMTLTVKYLNIAE